MAGAKVVARVRMLARSWFTAADKRTRRRRVLLSVAAACAVLAFIVFYVHLGLMYYFNPTRGNPPDRIVILTTSWCPYCRALKTSLTAARMPYVEIDVEQNWKTEYAYYATRRRGVPITVIGSSIVEGGMTDQLNAIKRVCLLKNVSGQYACDLLSVTHGVRNDVSPDAASNKGAMGRAPAIPGSS